MDRERKSEATSCIETPVAHMDLNAPCPHSGGREPWRDAESIWLGVRTAEEEIELSEMCTVCMYEREREREKREREREMVR